MNLNKLIFGVYKCNAGHEHRTEVDMRDCNNVTSAKHANEAVDASMQYDLERERLRVEELKIAQQYEAEKLRLQAETDARNYELKKLKLELELEKTRSENRRNEQKSSVCSSM
ncbi:uncharacterized protein LOC127857754 [Dreissena polymorpha]|uniref:Uncharacterized protein n=1 Tax=Dreissena polymorpha TaxID=45954 RepID=A0A9D4BUM8_DREPO|nr:uncharacterized protein LOC127857754 [Dreissena polymorpha]XP_052250374.1 uncharacterized protein LOC127857754 [Dreissena polymorpha]KAH3709502.1 hypothetical protein DPMN_068965 [Dreissena polymorpha]